LSSICIPASVETLGAWCFYGCRSLSVTTFAPGSQLSDIEGRAFSNSGLRSLALPMSVQIVGSTCFECCRSLRSVTFEPGSQLERIAASAFSGSPQVWVVLPNGESYSVGQLHRGWTSRSVRNSRRHDSPLHGGSSQVMGGGL
jgi:hypothetical protein